MKFKKTLILFIAFAVLLAFVLLFEEFKGEEKESDEDKLVSLSSEDIQKITLKREDEIITFEKFRDEAEEGWIITEPLEAKADKYEVDRIANNFSDLRIERVVEEVPEDVENYEIPQKEITLWLKDTENPVKILVGAENPLDNTFFAKREDETRVVLIPSHLKDSMEKSLFEFRQKDIFKFESDNVKSLALRAKEIQWEAEKKKEEWFIEKPVKALAVESKISGILNSLSNLKAKEFISEEKQTEDLEKFGLDQPDYEITLSLPAQSQNLTFSLHIKDEKLYATTSLSSKIIEIEDMILSDLEEEVLELREKEVANFSSWEVNQLHLKIGELNWQLFKNEENNWQFKSPVQEEADNNKVQTFIRKVESLEATGFIDPPMELKDYGLDNPRVEIKIWAKENEEEAREITVLIGNEDKEAKTVVAQNARLVYLFRLDSSFLEEFPKDIKDWQPEPVEQDKEEKI